MPYPPEPAAGSCILCVRGAFRRLQPLRYRNNSFSFRTEQTFFKAMEATETMALLTFLACRGHFLTQRMHAIHFWESAARLAGSMACTGQFLAHRPHFTQSVVGFGTSPAPHAFL